MAIFYICSFDQYGASAGTKYGGGNAEQSGWNLTNDIFLGDGWASQPAYLNVNFRWSPFGTMTIEEPSWGARQGDYALMAKGFTIDDEGDNSAIGQTRPGDASLQLAIPGNTALVRTLHMAYAMNELPLERGHGYIAIFQDSNGDIRGGLRVAASGRLEVVDGTDLRGSGSSSNAGYATQPGVLGITSAPVVSPLTWYSLNVRITTNATDATVNVEVWVGDIAAGNKVIDLTGIAFTDTDGSQPAGAANNIDIIGFLPASVTSLVVGTPDTNERAIRDIVLSDASGSYNTAPLGQVFTSAQEMRTEDTEGTNWGVQHRVKFSDGIGNFHVNNTGIRMPDTAALEIALQNFTFETEIRFSSLPAAGEIMEIFTKYAASANLSYRLYYDGTSASLIWEISTDGAANVIVKTATFVPQLDRWYHVAVSRWTDTTQFTNIFIDGVGIGVRQADDNTYFGGSASVGIGANFGTGSTPVTADAFDGYMDETRFTVNLARYTGDFTPPAAVHGRIVGDDANIAKVMILIGYDAGSIVDESPTARALTINASPVTADLPADGDNSYQVLNQRPAWDDTYVEAAYTFATGVLTLTGLPIATETVTIGSKTYTWIAAVGAANTVKIGANAADSLNNLIAAVNAGAGSGTLYGTGTAANADATAQLYADQAIQIVAAAIGASTVVTTETMTAGSFAATTLDNGQDIPSDSDFTIERLPIDVSGILAVQGTARVSKTDAGSASMRLDFIGPSAAVAAGSALTVDLNPSWQRQVFEEDPDTSASLTPSSIIGGRLRFKRTA